MNPNRRQDRGLPLLCDLAATREWHVRVRLVDAAGIPLGREPHWPVYRQLIVSEDRDGEPMLTAVRYLTETHSLEQNLDDMADVLARDLQLV